MSRVRVALVLVLLGGCNTLLGFGDPTLASLDPSIPSCATGWHYRMPVSVNNATGGELDDYQILVTFDAKSLVAAGKLQANGIDLRFTTGADQTALAQAIESGIATATARAWVSVPVLASGSTTLYLYYGNPNAQAWVDSPFVEDVIANPSFETAGGWTLDQVTPPGSDVKLPYCRWATDGACSISIDLEESASRSTASTISISQDIVLPDGAQYVVRFDVNVLAASNSGAGQASDASFFFSVGSDLSRIWELFGTDNITGSYSGLETAPLGAGSTTLSVGTRVERGDTPGYAHAYFDHLRVRRFATPQPTAQVGDEESICP